MDVCDGSGQIAGVRPQFYGAFIDGGRCREWEDRGGESIGGGVGMGYQDLFGE